jgi:hypothetical protein
VRRLRRRPFEPDLVRRMPPSVVRLPAIPITPPSDPGMAQRRGRDILLARCSEYPLTPDLCCPGQRMAFGLVDGPRIGVPHAGVHVGAEGSGLVPIFARQIMLAALPHTGGLQDWVLLRQPWSTSCRSGRGTPETHSAAAPQTGIQRLTRVADQEESSFWGR